MIDRSVHRCTQVYGGVTYFVGGPSFESNQHCVRRFRVLFDKVGGGLRFIDQVRIKHIESAIKDGWVKRHSISQELCTYLYPWTTTERWKVGEWENMSFQGWLWRGRYLLVEDYRSRNVFDYTYSIRNQYGHDWSSEVCVVDICLAISKSSDDESLLVSTHHVLRRRGLPVSPIQLQCWIPLLPRHRYR